MVRGVRFRGSALVVQGDRFRGGLRPSGSVLVARGVLFRGATATAIATATATTPTCSNRPGGLRGFGDGQQAPSSGASCCGGAAFNSRHIENT